ncbi:MAG: hypothetical protein WCJ53_11700, partial [Mycobacteriaceae bacterium]
MDQSSIATSELLIEATQPSVPGPRKGRRRARSRRIAPYSWLGAGAVGLGVGAALVGAALTGGSGTAIADTGTDTHVSSPGAETEGARATASRQGGVRGAAATRSAHRSAVGQPTAGVSAGSARSAASREKTGASKGVANGVALPKAVGAPSASAATYWQPGQILKAVYSIFVSDGTSGSPNAGLLVGNGYSYSSFDTQCVGSFVCDGGRGGLLLGAGGNGYNGGNGGDAGLFFGTVFLPGNGGAGSSTCSGAACTTGSGGNALLIGPGGSGGNGADAVYDSTTGALISAATAGGRGGNGGLIWGIGGAGGYGGA